MKFKKIETIDKLCELYGSPMDLVIKKVKSRLDKYTTQFLELSAFTAYRRCFFAGGLLYGIPAMYVA